MGFWKKFAGYAMIAGGVGAAAFTGGASLALVGAGAKVLGEDAKAEGAEKAAEQQQTATEKAIATQQTAAKAAQQSYQPYTQMGNTALSSLGQYMGFPAASGGAGAAGAPGVSVGAMPAGMQQATGVRPDTTESAPAQAPRYGVPRDGAATPQTQAAQQSQSSYNLSGLQNGGLVQMRAPTGDVQMVPPEQVAYYEQRGARRVA